MQISSFFDLNIYVKLITIIIELNFLSKFSRWPLTNVWPFFKDILQLAARK